MVDQLLERPAHFKEVVYVLPPCLAVHIAPPGIDLHVEVGVEPGVQFPEMDRVDGLPHQQITAQIKEILLHLRRHVPPSLKNIAPPAEYFAHSGLAFLLQPGQAEGLDLAQ